MGKIKSEIPRGHFVFRSAPDAIGERALNSNMSVGERGPIS